MPDDDGARSGPTRRVAGSLPALVLFGAAAILVVLSVAVGPMNVTTPGWLDTDTDVDAPEVTPEPPPSLSNLPTQQPTDENGDASFSFPWEVALVLVVVLALIIAYVVYKRWPRRNPARSGRIVGGEVDEMIDEMIDELRQAAEDAGATLDRDDGRTDEAIIAAWLRLEDAAAATGDSRQPHQTPSEFTAGLLRHHNADAASVQQLLDLYERARFATTPDISATDVATARAALATIMQTLAAAAPAGDAR